MLKISKKCIELWLHLRESVHIPLASKFYLRPLPDKIQDVHKILMREDSINEKCVLMQHILYRMKQMPYMQNMFKDSLMRQMMKISVEKHYRNRTATILWLSLKFNKKWKSKKIQKLYKELLTTVVEDNWYVTLQQVIRLMQSMVLAKESNLFYQVEKDVYNRLVKVIEYNVKVTLSDVNMQHFNRIVTALVDLGIHNSILWQQIQFYVINNLGMQYTPQTICGILKAYALTRNGSQQFYQMMQKVLFLGHWYNRRMIRYQKYPIQLSGDFVAIVLDTYSVVIEKTNIIILGDFADYIVKQLQSRKMGIQELNSVVKIIHALPSIQFTKQEVQQMVANLPPRLDLNRFTLQQLKNFQETIRTLYEDDSRRYGFYAVIEKFVIKMINNDALDFQEALQWIDYFMNDSEIQVQRIIQCYKKQLESRIQYMEGQRVKSLMSKLEQFPKLGTSIHGLLTQH